jgi:hypothetical protein
MANFSASVPVDQAQAVNDALAELGHGPGNFSIPCGDAVKITHAALHCWPNDAFRADLEALIQTYPDIKITDGKGEPNLVEHVAEQPFELTDVDAFKSRNGAKAPKAEGALATKDAKQWESVEAENIWPVGTIGWKEKAEKR